MHIKATQKLTPIITLVPNDSVKLEMTMVIDFEKPEDFIPELIPAISQCYAGNQTQQLRDCFTAYEFMMNRVLEGINYAVEIASGGAILLDLDSTIYNTGNIFEL